MQFAGWLIRLSFFGLILWFALKNTIPVPLRLTETLRWDEVPLIVVMLGCFVLGAIAGAFAIAPKMYRMRREISRIRTHAAEQDAVREAAASAADDRLAGVARDAGAAGQLEVDTQHPR
jgi:uncharacterized integral membrane protein